MPHTPAQSLALALGLSALITVACRRVRLPALLPLLLAGLALGRSGLNIVDAASLGPALTGFITVALGLLIFEGALHLNKEVLGRVPRAVWGLLTIGMLITWAGAAAAGHYLLGMSVPIAILLGATLTVTGPTVVQPILRLLRVTPRLHTALAAEAVLIDPIGVVATVTTLELIRLYALNGAKAGLASAGVWIFAKPLLGGAGVGLVMGLIGYQLLHALGRRGENGGGEAGPERVRPEPQLINLVAVGVCMTCVGFAELIAPDAGLTAVTICGILMARAKVLGATELRAFKELLAVILVGTLFVLLSSRIEIAQMFLLDWRDAAFVLVLVFLIRPVAVFVSTWRSKLSLKERLFAGTFAPRGIVALSVAVVASTELAKLLATPASPAHRMIGWSHDAERLEMVMFVTIAGTVLLASLVSPVLAWLLRVRATEGTAVLLVGAHPLSITLAELLSIQGVETWLVDSNESRVAQAQRSGVKALVGDATDGRWMDDVGSPHSTGWVIAWTGNHDVDQVVARWAEDRLGPRHTGIWSSKPARGHLERADISGGDQIAEWLERLDDAKAMVAKTPDPKKLYRILGWVQEHRFTLNLHGTKVPEPDEKIVFVGLALANGTEGFDYLKEEPPTAQPVQTARA